MISAAMIKTIIFYDEVILQRFRKVGGIII